MKIKVLKPGCWISVNDEMFSPEVGDILEVDEVPEAFIGRVEVLNEGKFEVNTPSRDKSNQQNKQNQ